MGGAPICCAVGYHCVFANEHWASCLPSVGESPPLAPTASPTEIPVQPPFACAGPYEHCANPSWENEICCEEGYRCEYFNEHWASCRPRSTASLAVVSKHGEAGEH